MSDIMDRLARERTRFNSKSEAALYHDAHAEIERLRAENARLREALGQIAFLDPEILARARAKAKETRDE